MTTAKRRLELVVGNDAALDWTDPVACEDVVARLERAVEDLGAVAEDQTRSPGDRDLGRRRARATQADARRVLRGLLGFARRGLPGGTKP